MRIYVLEVEKFSNDSIEGRPRHEDTYDEACSITRDTENKELEKEKKKNEMEDRRKRRRRFLKGFSLGPGAAIAPSSVKGKPVLLVHFADAAADAAGRMAASI
ncbi:hypothetical protein K0M31_007184 [Melipona bicolor]|uniref:Uncharacterized protein n=1 Tax=Melipona bicolor TaxID=60889 RepID=A0AA40FRS1_9HYME|nr:hypothetical protein K0M31_007184 [Melipona bicolor]